MNAKRKKIGTLVLNRTGWKRRAIALARPRIRQIKNTHVVRFTPKTWYGVRSQLPLIYSFSTLPSLNRLSGYIQLFLLSYSFFRFFKSLLPVKHNSAYEVLPALLSLVYVTTTLYINSLTPTYAKPVFNTFPYL